MTERIVPRLSCDGAPGIVAEVTRFLHESGLNIVESAQFFDRGTARFFMRVVAEPLGGPADLSTLRAGFAPYARQRGLNREMDDPARKVRALISWSPGSTTA